MVGTLFLTVKRYIEEEKGEATWQTMLSECGCAGKIYVVMGNYPAAELHALIDAGSRQLGISRSEFLHAYGMRLSGFLLKMYASLIKPEWKTKALLLNTEKTLHAVVRSKDPLAKPARLEVSEQADGTLLLNYVSGNRLHELAIGIIRGMAAHFSETAVIEVLDIRDTAVLMRIRVE